MASDTPTFQNRHVVANVGSTTSMQLPQGEYTLKQGEAAPGLTVSSSGFISGVPTTPGVYVAVMEFCCD